MLLGSSALALKADREGNNKRERKGGFYVFVCWSLPHRVARFRFIWSLPCSILARKNIKLMGFGLLITADTQLTSEVPVLHPQQLLYFNLGRLWCWHWKERG